MIRSNDAEASQVASQIFAAHKEILQDFLQQFVLKFSSMKWNTMTKSLVAAYLDLCTLMRRMRSLNVSWQELLHVQYRCWQYPNLDWFMER